MISVRKSGCPSKLPDALLQEIFDENKRLRFMIENSFSVGDIMELLVAVE
jgi:hypothetical protein